MKINGHGDVTTIRLRHKGTEMNMQHILPEVYKESMLNEPTDITFVEFKDINEIENMICMLERFKKECEQNIGIWRIGRVRE